MTAPAVPINVRRMAARLGVFRPWILLGIQAVIILAAGCIAFLMRFDLIIPRQEWRHLCFGLGTWLGVKLIVFHLFALDRGWWRYASLPDLVRLLAANVLASAIAFAGILAFSPAGFPRSIYILDLLFCCVLMGGARITVRLAFEASRQHAGGAKKRILIYGAGAAGMTLLREIRQAALGYEVAGFIDDDSAKASTLVQRYKVLGTGAELTAIVNANAIEMVLIALPSASGSQIVEILNHCLEARVAYKIVPGLADIIQASGLMSQIRDVAVEDLLGRNPVRLEEEQIRGSLEGRVVLVTGAAGSIGSELCRQIARFGPAGIVGFDAAESPLFEIDREMRQAFPQVPFHAEIGSVQNCKRVDEVLSHHRPSTVYHAAAYKHVPLMETHVYEAIENNVFGTYNVAVAAADHGVEDFVMISSDKAVRPTNIMGCTKRVAEMLLLALQNGRTKYVAVRFGNVLGSNGSVIPIFKKQIAVGGPVTVTHPEMRRFFMTIPEACQLVLQAAVIGEGGQICVLNMGEPVKIVDLARNLILLSGLRPDEDIKIEFTGMRPGEKLYEELSTMLEETVPTAHEKVRIFTGSGLPEEDMLRWLDCLREICEARDVGRLMVALKEIVFDYSPSAHLLKRVIEHRPLAAATVASR